MRVVRFLNQTNVKLQNSKFITFLFLFFSSPSHLRLERRHTEQRRRAAHLQLDPLRHPSEIRDLRSPHTHERGARRRERVRQVRLQFLPGEGPHPRRVRANRLVRDRRRRQRPESPTAQDLQ